MESDAYGFACERRDEGVTVKRLVLVEAAGADAAAPSCVLVECRHRFDRRMPVPMGLGAEM